MSVSTGNLHIPAPTWVMFLLMLADVGLVTFGDPSAIWPMAFVTPLFKAVLAMLGVALTVLVSRQPAPQLPTITLNTGLQQTSAMAHAIQPEHAA